MVHRCIATYTLSFENITFNSLDVSVVWQSQNQSQSQLEVFELDQVVFSEVVLNNTNTGVTGLTPNTEYCVCVSLGDYGTPEAQCDGVTSTVNADDSQNQTSSDVLCRAVNTGRGKLFPVAIGCAIFLAVSFVAVVIADVIIRKTEMESRKHLYEDLIRIGRQEYKRQTTKVEKRGSRELAASSPSPS